MHTITVKPIDYAQQAAILAYMKRKKVDFEVSETQQNGYPANYKPLELWTEEEKQARKKFLDENAFFKPGTYQELVEDPFNLGF